MAGEVILVSACLLGVRCRWNSRRLRPKKELRGWRWVLPLCPEQLGGNPTPRPQAWLEGGDGWDVLKGRARVVNNEGEDVTRAFVIGAQETLRLARQFKVKRAYLKSSSPSCGREGVTRILLERSGIEVQEVK